MRLRKFIKSIFLIIQKFQFMIILNANWIDLIKFVCIIIDAVYILFIINYFNRFVWANAFKDHITIEIIYILRDVIASIFEWSIKFYSNNESHFVNNNVKTLLQIYNVNQFTKLINYLAFTNFLKRGVQEMLALINKKCIKKKITNLWGLFIKNNVLIINTKAIRVYEY